MSKKRILGTGLTILLVFIMLLVMAGPNLLAAQVASNPGNAPFTGNEKIEVLIGFHGPPNRGLVEAFGGEVYAEFTIVDVIAAQMTQQQANALARNPMVSYVELDAEVYAIAQEVPWGIDRVFNDASSRVSTWDATEGYGASVFVLDTGIDRSHEDLTVVNGRRFYTQGPFLREDDKYDDGHGHGTHVAGTIGARNNDLGVVGVAPSVALYAVKVLGDTGSGSVSAIIAGIQWSVNQNKKNSIINMSLGSSSYSKAFEDACKAAYDTGLLVVAAAGNSGNSDGTGDNVGYPAKYASVIAVAASDSSDKRAYFSSTGPDVELIAPGMGITSTVPGGYATYNGTSMASPHVAGVAALVWAADPKLTNQDVRLVLQDTAQYLNLPENHQGKGLVRADLAVAEVAGSTNVLVTGVSIVEGNQAIEVNKTLQLNVTIEPAKATNKDVTWSSSHTSIATVSPDGLVTGMAAGKAFITVTTVEGGHKNSIEVTVIDKPGGELTALFVAITNPSSGSSYTWNSQVDIAVKVTDADQDSSAVAGADVTVTIMSLGGTNLATYNGTSNAEGVFTARYRVPNKADTKDYYTITASASKETVGSEVVSVIFYVTGR